MGKFGKENFDEGNLWRIKCKNLENFEGNYNVKVVNPNDYFNFKEEPPAYKTQILLSNIRIEVIKKRVVLQQAMSLQKNY